MIGIVIGMTRVSVCMMTIPLVAIVPALVISLIMSVFLIVIPVILMILRVHAALWGLPNSLNKGFQAFRTQIFPFLQLTSLGLLLAMRSFDDLS